MHSGGWAVRQEVLSDCRKGASLAATQGTNALLIPCDDLAGAQIDALHGSASKALGDPGTAEARRAYKQAPPLPLLFPSGGYALLPGMPATDLFESAEALSDDELEKEIHASKARTMLLEAAKALRASQNGSIKAEAALFPGAGPPTGNPASKRKAVLRLLAERPDQAMKLSTIAKELIARQWMENSSRAVHSLGITVSKMFGNEELERPKQAHYRITDRGKAVDTS